MFTGHEFAEGGEQINTALKDENVKASFFFTGRFYRNKEFANTIKQLRKAGHYLGAHSDEHLLYCDWSDRNKLLVSRDSFEKDLNQNYKAMKSFGISSPDAPYFLPPYEWYNDSISAWTRAQGRILVNYTPGTLSHADYTLSSDKNYKTSETIWQSIVEREKRGGLNGFILLMHIGAGPGRKDPFYQEFPHLLKWLKLKGYEIVRIDEMLK